MFVKPCELSGNILNDLGIVCCVLRRLSWSRHSLIGADLILLPLGEGDQEWMVSVRTGQQFRQLRFDFPCLAFPPRLAVELRQLHAESHPEQSRGFPVVESRVKLLQVVGIPLQDLTGFPCSSQIRARDSAPR